MAASGLHSTSTREFTLRRPARFLAAVGAVLLITAAACFAIHARECAYLLRETAFLFDAPMGEEARAKALAHFVATRAARPVNPDSASVLARIEHKLPFEISPATVLDEGFAFPDARGFGPCGPMSQTAHAIATLRHVRAHKVVMGSGSMQHAMVALYADSAYRLFDPTYDFYWTDSTGHVATFDQVRNDSAVFAQVFRRAPNYPYRLDDASFFRWSRFGAPGALVRNALTSSMGRAWVENLDTPMLYEMPWWGYGWVSLLGGLFFTALGVAGLRRRA